MIREKSEKASADGASLASIDIGSHTARLLVAQSIGPPKLLEPLFRKRVYIRLAENFHTEGRGTLQPEAIGRTLKSLEDFASLTKGYGVESIRAVSTGVVREASNKDEFLRRIQEQTGIEVEVISGEEEAWLTEKGVLHALNMESGPFMIFDLGGGSTEFIYGKRESRKVKSVPLGAMVLAQKYLTSDPPQRERVEALGKEVDGLLKVSFSKYPHFRKDGLLVGTGGTVTALAAMIYAIDMEEVGPERMNGLILEREQLEDLFTRIKTMTTDERLKLPGLDRGRADVIPAGCMAVIRILRFLKTARMVVCLSDLLEGIIIAYLQGEKDA
jgi:exopolyphosphatase/guanosine-5'-triphosphate,3'-diphosphate pyrophosphatase